MLYKEPLRVGMEPFPGYRLSQFLGGGGFGEVWEAEVVGGRTVALKFDSCNTSKATTREIRSVQNVRQLKHPNLITIERIWAFQSYIVIAMELADGSLEDLFEAYVAEFGTTIPPEQVCSYLSRIADALDFLNARQHMIENQLVAIQHCDIKPSNLLVFGETVKIADFGLSSVTSSPLVSHMRAGTPAYMSPEAKQGRLSDRTDQYSLAITYCKLRGGKLPFSDVPPGSNGSNGANGSSSRGDPDLSMVSAKERAIIRRALSAAPQQRWPSCKELIGQLATAASGFSGIRLHHAVESGRAIERRKCPRYQGLAREVLVSQSPQEREPLLGCVLDLSTGGLCLSITEPAKDGALLRVRPVQPEDTIWVPVQVRHQEPLGKEWAVGCQFLPTASKYDLGQFALDLC